MDQGNYHSAPKSSFNVYYGLAFFLHLSFFLLNFPNSGMISILFMLGLSWNLVLLNSKLLEKSNLKKNRFSFIRFCFFQYRIMSKLLHVEDHPQRAMGARTVIPFLWANILGLIFGVDNQSFYVLWGSMIAEVVHGVGEIVLQVKGLEKI